MKKEEKFSAEEERMLVLAPTARDSQICCDTLRHAGIDCNPCFSLRELVASLESGAGSALITEEAFIVGEAPLLNWLENQPSWSDLPLLFLSQSGADSAATLRAMERLGNVIVLERPLRRVTLNSAARVALRERRRQYQTRRHLEMLQSSRDAAEEANRAKSEFLANMSHEIRTPMTAFMAAIDHLRDIDTDSQRLRVLDMADQSAQRLRTLIDDILDFSRIEARRVDLKEAPFELRSWIDDIMKMFTLSAQEKNLRLETEVAPDAPAIVVGDPDRLGQVLINLLGNAVKFTHEGEIRLRVDPRGPLLNFSVSDTGIGIPGDKRELLFESFNQVDSSFSRHYSGTGLGLAISKGLIEIMGGEITLRSREGEGSVFTFTVPLKAPAEHSSVQAGTSSDSRSNRSAGASILVAEDDPLISEVISAMLEKRGCLPEAAANGRDALEKWEVKEFDIILMDLQMPQLNGVEATRTIRERETATGGRTCIIGLTAHAHPEIKRECLASGMNQVLTKPVKKADLFSAIEICLSA
ncbi:MAG: ATP-binding protein [Desulfuromonadales bacterium]